jgi:DNA-binding NarL/FixJ family response regulator
LKSQKMHLILINKMHCMENPFIEIMLTKRELEVLELVASGLTNCDISSKLFVAESTVISHRKNIQKKLHAQNSCEMICIAFRKRILDL